MDSTEPVPPGNASGADAALAGGHTSSDVADTQGAHDASDEQDGPAAFGEDGRLLLDGIASGLRVRYLSARSPSLVALLNPGVGVARFCHPDFLGMRGLPTACVPVECPLCKCQMPRWLVIGAPFIDLERRSPGVLPLQYKVVAVVGQGPGFGSSQGSLERAIFAACPGGTVPAVKIERDERGRFTARCVTLPPDLAYSADLACMFWDWFAANGDDIARLLVATVGRAELMNDQRLRRRRAAEAL